MKQSTLGQLKKGDIFALRCDKDNPTLYVKDHYDFSSRKYAYHKYTDYNSEYFASKSKLVYISE